MSFEAAALIALAGCAIGGTIGVVGGVVGLLVGRRFRELPRVRCVATDWELTFEKTVTGRRAVCSFELDLFNQGQLATGIRGVSVSLHGANGGRALVERLRDRGSDEPLWSIDLPPRRWVHASAYAVFEGEDVGELAAFRSAHLLGQFPEGRTFDLKIVEREDFIATPKKTTSDRHDYVASHNFRSRLTARKRTTG